MQSVRSMVLSQLSGVMIVTNDSGVASAGSTIGERLKLERSILGLMPEALAKMIGVTKKAIDQYESDEAPFPLEKMALLHQHRFDLIFVLTGVRGEAQHQRLNFQEEKLVSQFRSLDMEGMGDVILIVSAMAQTRLMNHQS